EMITRHSDMIVADVDHLTIEQIENKWESLESDPHIWLLSRSPSTTGIKTVVPVDGLKELWPIREGMSRPEYAAVANDFHLAAYFALRRHMMDTHGLQIDGACKDVSRLTYLCYDEFAYSNPFAKPLVVGWSEDVKKLIDEERAREREEAARKRDRPSAKAKTAGAPPKAKSETAPASKEQPDDGSQDNARAGDTGPFHRLSDDEQEELIDACLAALHPDVVPSGFGSSGDPGDRHRWDVAIGMAIHSWDPCDRGMEKYLA